VRRTGKGSREAGRIGPGRKLRTDVSLNTIRTLEHWSPGRRLLEGLIPERFASVYDLSQSSGDLSSFTFVKGISYTHAVALFLLADSLACSSFCRFETAAYRLVRRTAPVSTSTLRATTNLCHSSVRPVPTWTRQSLRSRPLFRDLAPSLFGEGARSRNRRTIMKVEQAKQIVSTAIEQLSQALERGHSETLRNYLAAIGRFHRYSLRNVMLIASQNPTAMHFEYRFK